MSERDRERRETSRRAWLAGVAGGIATLPLVGSTTAAADGYDEVIDLVEEGARSDGSESIVPYLEEYADDDTLLKLPPGEYLMTEQFRFTGFSNFGIVGDDATIVPGTVEELDGQSVVEGTFEGPTRLFRLGVSYAPGDELHVEGLTFDFTADNAGFRAIETYCERDLLVRDIDVVGEHDVGSFGPGLFALTDPDGIATVEGFRAPDGGAFSENTVGDIAHGPTGILVPDGHRGKLRFRDCELGGFPDNGLYATCEKGRIVVEGGVYRNSNVSNIRLMGDYSYVKGATVVVDDNPSEADNQRGIRLDHGRHLWVYDTEIRLEEPNGHAITVMGRVDKARIQDSQITVGDEVNNAIVVQPEAGDTDIFSTSVEMTTGGHALLVEEDGGVVDCRDVTVTGDASGASGGRHAIRCHRDDCRFRHLHLRQDGPGLRRGLYLRGDNCRVYSGEYVTSHIPIVVDADGALVEDVTARSLDGYEAIKILEGVDNAEVVTSALYNDIWNKGGDVDLVENSVR